MKTKKINLLALILALVCLMTCCFTSCAGDKTDDTAAQGGEENAVPNDPANFVFKEEEFEGVKYCSLDGVTESGKKLKTLEVPETYNGLTVLALNSECFSGCDKLETVIIHSSVREFYSNLFPGCTALRNIKLDFEQLYKEIQADSTVADTMTCSTAPDGTVSGSNSFLEGLDESKIKLVFTNADAYDFFSAEYTWGLFSSVMTLEK